MPCQLGYTILGVLLLGFAGFLMSLVVLAPFYFSSRWSEKCTIERVIMIGFPCIGALMGLFCSPRDVSPGSSSRSESEQRSGRQQRSSGVSESAQRPKNPQTRSQPTRMIIMRPLRAASHVLPPIDVGSHDLEAQVLATSQSASAIADLNIPRPAALAPTAQNSSAWSVYLSSSYESSTSLPPYAILDPEDPALPAPTYSR